MQLTGGSLCLCNMKTATTLLVIALRPSGIRWYALWTWSGSSHISGFPRNDSSAPASGSMPNVPRSSASLIPSRSRSLPSSWRPKPAKAPTPWIAGPSWQQPFSSQDSEVQRSCCQARPPVARCRLRGRPDGAKGPVHGRRAWPRRRSVHAASLRSPGREGAAPDIRADARSAGRKEGLGGNAGQSPQSERSPAQRAGQRFARPPIDLRKSLAPVIETIGREGANTLRSMAAELNRRGFKSARGGKWYPSSVANLLSRADRSFL